MGSMHSSTITLILVDWLDGGASKPTKNINNSAKIHSIKIVISKFGKLHFDSQSSNFYPSPIEHFQKFKLISLEVRIWTFDERNLNFLRQFH